MFFVDLRADVIPFMLKVEGVTDVGTYAVIHSLVSEPAPMADSCLLCSGVCAKGYNFVSTTSFKYTAIVIDNVGCTDESVLLSPTSQ
jgi:hypothetical protein